MVYFLWIFLLTTSLFAMDSQTIDPNKDDFTIIHNDKGFIDNKKHNSLMPLNIRLGLINKGYTILQEIINGATLVNVHHDNTYFPNAGCAYVGAMNYAHRGISLGSVKNFCTNPFSVVYGKDPQAKKKTSDRQKMLESLIAIIWAMADHADKIGQGFASGSFSVIDPHGYLFNFFAEYAIMVNEVTRLEDLPYGSFNPLNPINGNVFAYSRDPKTPVISGSSHYKNTTIFQMGIDARFESNAYTISAFPYGATHIIVGRVKTLTGFEKTIVKFEPYGTGTIAAWLAHGLEFIHSISHRSGKRSEKDIPMEIKESFKKVIQLVQETEIPESNLDVVNTMIEGKVNLIHDNVLKTYDLSSWIAFAMHVFKHADEPNLKKVVKEFLNTVEDTYHDGIFSNDPKVKIKAFYRTGNEIVVDLKDLIL